MTPTFRTGNMWNGFAEADLFCVTTNATLNAKGELVMGRGIAAEAKNHTPRLPKFAGLILEQTGQVGKAYGLQPMPYPFLPFGLFQVKLRWKDAADMDLIEYSVASLLGWIEEFEATHDNPPIVHLNFPGIGNGRLTEDEVRPALLHLPPSVSVWTKGEEG